MWSKRVKMLNATQAGNASLRAVVSGQPGGGGTGGSWNAGMISGANQQAIEAAGLPFILGMRIPRKYRGWLGPAVATGIRSCCP